VAAADADRRRFERDLHDGVQQDLIAVAVSLQLVRRLANDDPAAAGELLDEIRRDVHDALANVRELATTIYPPLLASRGLGDALRAAGARVQADGLPRYAAEIEATVYFCCVEAAAVRLWHESGELRFEVTFDGAVPASLEDRLGAVGGRLAGDGTRLSGAIPAQPASAR
jgi:hypothetical protein